MGRGIEMKGEWGELRRKEKLNERLGNKERGNDGRRVEWNREIEKEGERMEKEREIEEREMKERWKNDEGTEKTRRD